jgi:SNF2 family DNA or RNA helicase
MFMFYEKKRKLTFHFRIYISDPVAFFRIFESHEGSAESGASQFFASAKKNGRPRKQPSRLPLAEAAFALLQWAQYGDDPKFEPPDSKEAVEDDSSDSASDELSILNEDDFEAGSNEEKEAEEWAKNVVDETSEVAKESELPEADDPAGFTDDVVLRPYQRQALYWMLQRENENKDRKELEKELTLLAELSRNKSHQLVMDPPKQAIVCEVGPVRVSQSMAQKSCTIDGVENPVNHPLWQRRFLASADKTRAISFYVNELLGTASSRPPNPPRQCAGGILADAMGLGKTIMLLALILKDNELGSMKDHDEQDGDVMIDDNDDADKKLPARKEGRPTLVVAPLSLILQWEEEMATKTNLKHLVYYGESAKGGIHSMSFKGLDVVVTTCEYMRVLLYDHIGVISSHFNFFPLLQTERYKESCSPRRANQALKAPVSFHTNGVE